MFRRITPLALWFAMLAGVGLLLVLPSRALAQQPQPQPTQEKPPVKPPPPEKKPAQQKALSPGTPPTAEQVAEAVVFTNGSRELMAQIRRTGIERGRITRVNQEGKNEVATYERRFIRGENMEKDRIRLEQKMPTAEYALIYSSGQTWGVINEAIFTPRQETAQDFLSQQWHGIEALLRYKENGSTLNYVGKDKQQGLDLHVLEVTDKDKSMTRYYISAKTGRVLWLEYERDRVKFMRRFYDYHVAQGTLVPFRSVLFRDGKQVEETQIMTITYGSKVDAALFQNPNSPNTSSAANP